ncbi:MULTISPECIES: glycine zipper 2TM domain-containing protein [unclassified Halomonas]|uniref:glycine zipper 2TM domain-containing protein n=1 Tax=unclassified Halomonas TaxID=2609666 RepID=UPI0020970375|nr:MULTISPECIES: glycine zipper 2TM domain-containing protein [unclassified Halomonas]MCJ8287310.1 glycine zipper 2TM domain-containing protein [Halomonas sp.]MCO7217268.1 glycine zipper 2TM domain-containing protein [Halomonas sp. OfavH-34-E]NQY72029.1 glycine zipper 2TM domain-containing protein [Halomonas sp.]
MSKSIIVGSTLAVFGLGGLAFGAWQVQQAPQGPQFADITAVTPVTETVSTPREVCENVQVTRQAPTRDPHSILGSAAGAVVGGLVGNQIGGGSGRKIATVAGAIGGGFAGREVQRRVEAGQTYTTTEQRCHTVNDTREKTLGYDVAWEYDGVRQVARLEQAPDGERVLIEQGQPQWDVVRGTPDKS